MMNVLLVGLGRMGQRYQRLLEKMFAPELVLYTVDPKLPTNSEKHHYADISEVPDSIPFKLAVDARPNLGRLGMFKHFLVRGIPYLVIEKPTAASIEESKAMLELYNSASKPPRILTPFYRRFAPSFQPDVLSQLNAGQLKSIVIQAGAVGLGCVGIHYVDLANFLFGSLPEKVIAELELDTIPSPRGEQFRDHAGWLVADYPQGRLILDLHTESAIGGVVTLNYQHGRIQIFDSQPQQWLWFRQSDKLFGEPYYKTHLESPVSPPIPYGFNLEEAMATAIHAMLGDVTVGRVDSWVYEDADSRKEQHRQGFYTEINDAAEQRIDEEYAPQGPKCQHALPSLAEGDQSLKILAMAMKSHETGSFVFWEDHNAIKNSVFQFT